MRLITHLCQKTAVEQSLWQEFAFAEIRFDEAFVSFSLLTQRVHESNVISFAFLLFQTAIDALLEALLDSFGVDSFGVDSFVVEFSFLGVFAEAFDLLPEASDVAFLT